MDQTSIKAVAFNLFAQGRRKKTAGVRSLLCSYLSGKIILASFLFAALGAWQQVLAQTSWPRYRFDAGLRGRAEVNGPTMPEVKWTVPVGAEKIESPVVAPDSSVIFTSRGDEFVYALKPDGSLKWKFSHDHETYSAPPVIGRDGTVYAGTQQGSFLAIDLNGSLRWRAAVGGWVSFSANVDAAGNLYLPVDDGFLYVFDGSGNLLCRGDYEGEKPANTPALGANGRVYAPAGNNIHVFDSSCRKIAKWNHPALGAVAWTVLSADGGTLYAGSLANAAVVALNATSGNEIWVYRYEQRYGPPCPVALGPEGSLYFAGFEGSLLFALSPDGNPKAGWPFDAVSGRYKTMPVVDAQGNVFIVNENSNFGLFALSPDKQLLWRLPEVQCKYSIAFGPNGTLYVPSLRKIYAVGQKPPHLVVGPNPLAFGAVCLNEEKILTATLYNRGASDLVISAYELISPVFRLEAAEMLIAPGDSAAVSVGFTPTQAGSFSDSLLVFSNDPDQNPFIILLSGEGIAPQIAGPDSLIFPPVEVGFAARDTVLVAVVGTCTLRVDSAKTNSADFSVIASGFPVEIAAGSSLHLLVEFKPGAAGIRNATLQVFSDDPDTNPLEIQLRGTGTRPLPRWQVSPPALDFAACLDTSVRKYVRIENTGLVEVAINSAAISNAAFRVDTTGIVFPLALASSQVVFLPVRFTPADTNAAAGVLTIASSADAVPQSFQVALTGKGSRPQIELFARPPALEICRGQSGETKIVVYNPSATCTLSVDSFRVAIGPLSALAPSSVAHPASAPIIVAPGDSAVIPFEFVQPQNSFELRVTFYSNADGSPHLIAVPVRVLSPAIAADSIVDFGAVTVQQTAQDDAIVGNAGKCDLRILSARISGRDSAAFFVDIASLPATLLAGDSLALRVTFTPADTGAHTAVLLVENDDPDSNPVRIVLRGEGRRDSVFAQPGRIVFRQVCLGGDSTQIVEIINNGSDEIVAAAIGFVLRRPEFSVEPTTDFRVLPGQRDTLTIGFRPTSLDRVADTLRIVWQDANVRPVSIPVSGQAVAGQIAGPAQHVFPRTPVNQTEIDTIYVRNFGECDLTVDSTVIVKDLAAAAAPMARAAQDPPFRVMGDFAGAIIPPGDSLGIAVAFTPHETGVFVASLQIYNSDPDSARDNPFKVRLIGEGTPVPPLTPDIAVDPDTLNFGARCATASLEIIVSNKGNAALRIDSLVFSDPAYSGAPPAPFSLLPNEEKTVTVTFDPDAAQSGQGVLFLYSNDPDGSENPYKVVLLGSKGQPNIAGANQLLFAPTSVGNFADGVYTFYNLGACSLRVDALTIAGQHAADFRIVAAPATPFYLNEGDSARVTIRFAPSDPSPRNATLNISSSDGDESPKVVQLQGNGLAPVIGVGPNPLDFGKVRVGQDSCAFVFIKNNSADSLAVDSVTLRRGLAFKVEGQGLDLLIMPGGQAAIQVCFVPLEPGLFSDTLDVPIARIVNGATGPDSIFSVALKGEGTVAVLYAQSPLDLTAERVGRFIRVTAYDGIRNIGTAPLTILKLQQPSSDFTVELSKLLPLTLQPDDAINVHVIFRPSRDGELRNRFVIVSDAFRDTLHTVELRGRGLAELVPDLAVYPETLDFGRLYIQKESKDSAFYVINNGPLELHNVNVRLDHGNEYEIVSPAFPYPALASGDSIRVTVKFKPLVSGVKKIKALADSRETPAPRIVDLTGAGAGRPNHGVRVRPEVFTPNHDGYNDVARFEFQDIEEIFEPVIKLYNLRGQLIATLEQHDSGVITWDGRDDRGHLVAPHTYLWYLQDGDKVWGSGHVGVVR